MYLFKPYPGDMPYRGNSLQAANWDAQLVTVEGGHAGTSMAAAASAFAEREPAIASQPLLVKGRKYLDLASQLVQQLNGAQPGASPMTQALDDCKSGVAQIETAMIRLNRLRAAVPSLGTTPLALKMFDHAVRKHEALLRRACHSTITALDTFAHAIQAPAEQTRARAAAAPSDTTAPTVMALHQLIAAIKGLVSMIMATVMAPERLARYSSAGTSEPAPHASDLERAASALREVRTDCQDMLAKLRDADQGDDPDFLAAGDADGKVCSYLALFELLHRIEDHPLPGGTTRQEARMLAMMQPIHTRMTEELAQVLETTIARYPEEQRGSLELLHALAFPGRAAPKPGLVAPAVAQAREPTPLPAAAIPDPPATMPAEARTWTPSVRTLGGAVAAGMLCVTLSLL